jgi:hypothetical protein
MAKTVFTDGDVLPTAHVNSIYGSDAAGGHRHDGADSDGHVGKINLTNATDVTGVLPAANTDLGSDDIDNDSGVTGTAVSDALDTLDTALDTLNSQLHDIRFRSYQYVATGTGSESVSISEVTGMSLYTVSGIKAVVIPFGTTNVRPASNKASGGCGFDVSLQTNAASPYNINQITISNRDTPAAGDRFIITISFYGDRIIL